MEKKTIFLIFSVLFSFSVKLFAQQETQVLVYNVALGGVTSGIGAAINKKKTDKFFPTFWRGFKYGCIGGSFLYGGKKLSYLINKQNNLAWGWPSKLVHSYGSTIMETASKNEKDVFSKLSFPVGFIRMNFSFKKDIKFNAQLQPGSLASFVVNASYGKFKSRESLLIGTPVFSSDSYFIQNREGFAIINTFTYSEFLTTKKYEIIAHEHIHILQEREYLVMNTWFKKPLDKQLGKLNKSSEKLARLVYLDIPYNYGFYTLLKQKPNCYFKNHFEFEAKRFATNQFVQKCF